MTKSLQLACNQYAWHTFLTRAGRTWPDDLDRTLAAIREAGFDGLEPLIDSVDQLRQLAPAVQRHGLALRSVYVNSTLHRPETAAASVEQVSAIAKIAQSFGTEIIVTNPSPIRWGGAESKTDTELATQATALDQLGARLRRAGLTLAYHVHDAEFRHAAREFHHMLLATDPAHVTLCFDPDWTYRGAGYSQLALFDIATLYGRRITEVHLRQSQNGIWSETFGPGDIDYTRLVAALAALDVHPHWVLEQAVEADSPQTLDVGDAQAASVQYAQVLLTYSPAEEP